MRVSLVVACLFAVASPVYAASLTSGRTHEILTLPNGMEIIAPKTEDFVRTGHAGAWGGRVHARTGETVNNQYNPSDRAGGSYVNSGGISGLRLVGTADSEGKFRLAIVDAWDQRPTTSFEIAFRAGGETVGTFKLTEREATGTAHYAETGGFRPGQRVVAWIKQTSKKWFSGDIAAFGLVSKRVCK
ncbi:hypothetical protein HNP73_002713 [Amaricoccus macauensis]|uniref:Uncharacterized protein n=1 Tax=Amaricoccus macauensis TaxID=57001 RepID=A0A840SLE9_9RHOB|nr:hypothetical protein [Amaricoccus macauensis]MBB5222777.1 hypothetical protein [Amaricoccus macauensis]